MLTQLWNPGGAAWMNAYVTDLLQSKHGSPGWPVQTLTMRKVQKKPITANFLTFSWRHINSIIILQIPQLTALSLN